MAMNQMLVVDLMDIWESFLLTRRQLHHRLLRITRSFTLTPILSLSRNIHQGVLITLIITDLSSQDAMPSAKASI
jgi:hypothetical protein